MLAWILCVAGGAEPVPIPGNRLEDSLRPPACLASPEPRVAWTLELGPLGEGCSLQASEDGWLAVTEGRVVRFDLDGQLLGELEGADAVAVTWQEGLWVARETGVERWDGSLSRQWSTSLGDLAPLIGAPVVGQLDDDPALEVVVAGKGGVAWLDDDGTRLGSGRGSRPIIFERQVISQHQHLIGPADGAPWVAAGFYENSGAPPLLADTDNDGMDELVAMMGPNVTAFRPDGSMLWIVRMHQPPRDRMEGWSPLSAGPVAWSREADCVVAASSTRRQVDGRALHCIGAEGLRWRQRLPGSGSRSGVVLADADGRAGHEVLLALDNGEVWALDLAGRMRWTWSTDALLTCAPAVATTRRGRPLVLVGTPRGLVALRPRRPRGC